MLREHNSLLQRLHRFWDISLTIAAFTAAFVVKKHWLPVHLRGLVEGPNYTIVLLLLIIIWYVTFTFFRLYDSYRRRSLAEILLR